MPSNYTEHYQLNQWEPGDQVQRVDFNADNAKIDAAIKAVDTKAAAKAEQSALTAEANTRVTQVASINTKINAINAALPKKGNCEIYATTYVGDGAAVRTLTFPKKPLFIFGMTKNLVIQSVYGSTETMCRTGGEGNNNVPTTWSGNSLTWTAFASDSFGPNRLNTTYYLVVMMDAST